MQIRDATFDHLAAIVALLENANDAPWPVAPVAREKCFAPGISGPPRTLLATEGDAVLGLVTISRGALRLIAVRRDARRRGIGSRLLANALERETSLIAFGEPGNYFLPGVPEDDRATRAFFEARGFAPLDPPAENLVIPLQGNERIPKEPPSEVSRAQPAERQAVLEFIRTRFAPAWELEASLAWRNDPPTLFVARDAGGAIAGFAAHETNNRGLGFFGPMGVSDALRGRGIGRALLLASLADLRRLGHGRAVISWVANAGFYTAVAGDATAVRMVRYLR